MRKIFKQLFDSFLKKRKILIIYRLGRAVGDHLLMTGFIKLLKDQHQYKVYVFSNYPDLFKFNKKIEKIYKLKFNLISSFTVKFFNYLKCENIKEFLNPSENPGKIFALSKYQNIHIAQYQSINFNLDLNFENLKNEFFLSSEENKVFSEKFKLPDNYALIQSGGKISFTPNREWGAQNFQKIIDNLNHINWVQIGGDNDVVLKNTNFFYYGKSLRELAYIISKSKFILCQEGFYYHLANAFTIKKFLIMSGFMHKKNIFYNNNNNILIHKTENLKCYPCYKLYECNSCKQNLKLIRPEKVVEIIKSNI
jgi:ADP-heptose:LPS heptosyltransferase